MHFSNNKNPVEKKEEATKRRCDSGAGLLVFVILSRVGPLGYAFLLEPDLHQVIADVDAAGFGQKHTPPAFTHSSAMPAIGFECELMLVQANEC